jgi:predicted amidophosphoribosyltransferase
MPPGANTPRCGDCLQNPPAFDSTIVACDYEAPQDRLVLSLKFGHHLALAPVFAAMLRDAILRQPHQDLPDFLCVVPLSQNRLTERGFNQALEIARPLAQHLGIPCIHRHCTKPEKPPNKAVWRPMHGCAM